MDKVVKLIPKNVVQLFQYETVELEPKVTVEFDIEIYDYTGQVKGIKNALDKDPLRSLDDWE